MNNYIDKARGLAYEIDNTFPKTNYESCMANRNDARFHVKGQPVQAY